ncbi:MAG: dihydroneopterin aldolase [Candidatus Eremiobacteraeota bacterium]|nr:dihydroneopterin aldolase [Candidatus Eremiobacteraeota bacterium]
MDEIALHGVRAYGRHGANPGEREQRQLIEVDLTAELDLQAAQRSDELAETMDYDALHDRIVRIVSTTSYALLERLGSDLLDAAFADERVARATVTLSKPQILNGATPSVRLTRDRIHRNRQ